MPYSPSLNTLSQPSEYPIPPPNELYPTSLKVMRV